MYIHYLIRFKAFDNYKKRLNCQKKNEFGRDNLQAGKQEAV